MNCWRRSSPTGPSAASRVSITTSCAWRPGSCSILRMFRRGSRWTRRLNWPSAMAIATPVNSSMACSTNWPRAWDSSTRVIRTLPLPKGSFSIVALLMALIAGGCGYTFSAADTLPPSAHTIYVARFTNSTNYTGLQDVFMRYMKDEIARHDRLRLVDDPAQADLELSGVIVNADPYPSALNAVGEPTIYALGLQVNATLVDKKTGKILWSGVNITSQQQYPVVPQAGVAT